MGWGWGTHIQKIKPKIWSAMAGRVSLLLIYYSPFWSVLIPVCPFSPPSILKPPSLDLVGEIVHGSTDLLSMSRWGGGGTPLVQMLRQKKDTHGSAGCPFWRTSFTKQHLQLPFMSFLLVCQSLYVHLNSYTFIGNFFSL